MAYLDEDESVFECSVCKHSSCRFCKEVPHKGKTCKDTKAEKEALSAHAHVASKMTEALVRECPGRGCGTRFFKEDGCNKMKCPTCQATSCYLCRQIITGYDHFCRIPHCTHEACGKCVLFTDTVADDRQARRAVFQQEQQTAGVAAHAIQSLISPEQQTKKKKLTRPQQNIDRLRAPRRLVFWRPLPQEGANQPDANEQRDVVFPDDNGQPLPQAGANQPQPDANEQRDVAIPYDNGLPPPEELANQLIAAGCVIV
jgi:hypothetical protein